MITHKGLLHLGFSKDDFFLQDDSDGKGVYIKEWNSDKPQPSASEIQTASDEYKAIHDSTQYQRDRATEYPPMADYLDGIVKNDKKQINQYIDDCLAIKQKYPK